MGLKNNIKNPAKNKSFKASLFLPKTLAKITSNAIKDALTIVAEPPVIMANKIMEVPPTMEDIFLPKKDKSSIKNSANTERL